MRATIQAKSDGRPTTGSIGSGQLERSARAGKLYIALLLALLAFSLGATNARADLTSATVSADGTSATGPHLTVSLVSSAKTIAPGAGFQTGLHFKMEPGWHVYWVNAGDSGEPPSIKWDLPTSIVAGPIQYPAPHRLPYGPLTDYGYPDEVLFPIDMDVSPALKPGAPLVLAAKVDWLVCRESCIPGKASLALHLPTGAQPAADPQGLALIQGWNKKLPKPLPRNESAAFSVDQNHFNLAIKAGHDSSGVQFFPFDKDLIDNTSPQKASSANDGVFLAIKQDASLKTAPGVLSGVVVFGDGSAYEVHAHRGSVNASGISQPASPAKLGLLRALGLALGGGMILNLMPCVFPVLFIKALSLVQSSREQRHEMRLHGLVYTLGILVSFWAVVGVLLALKAGGSKLGWGFQFQSPSFLAVMALLLFFLGLSLAGMFEIGLRLTSAGGSLAEKPGYEGSFFTGVLAMVVATPCTAPFMGAAIGYALAQPAWVSFLVFTALGAGLAAPYLLLAFQPAWTRLLPRPGAWMEVLKQATAVPIFATVIWLVWLFTTSAGDTALVGLLLAFLLLGIAAWVLGRWPAKQLPGWIAALIIVMAIFAPLYTLHAYPQLSRTPTGPVSASDQNAWQPFTPDIVAKSRASGRAVLVDFTASWCLSCQVNERVVLDRPDVQQHLKASNIALIRADWTHHDDDIAQALAKLGRSGVPAYVVYAADADASPELLPEVLTSSILFNAVDKAARPKTMLTRNLPPSGAKTVAP